MVNKKYITQLPETTTPVLSGYTIYDNGSTTYRVSIDTIADLVNTKDVNLITGGTFTGNTLILQDVNGGSVNINISTFNEIKGNIISGGTLYGDGSNLTGIVDRRLISGEYNPIDGDITFVNNLNETFLVTGLTTNVKNWYTNESKFVKSDETIVISNNLILENSDIFIQNSNTGITIGNQVFYKRGEIFIGGNLILVDSNIINYGMVSVAGSIILNGNSTITGTGIII